MTCAQSYVSRARILGSLEVLGDLSPEGGVFFMAPDLRLSLFGSCESLGRDRLRLHESVRGFGARQPLSCSRKSQLHQYVARRLRSLCISLLGCLGGF